MAYSNAMFQALSILIFIHFKSEESLYEYLSTKKISELLNIPVPTTVKVLSKLTAAGLTHAKEGAKGGILLAKPVSEITFLDVFYAIEQEKPLFKTQLDCYGDDEEVKALKEKGIGYLKDAEYAMKESLEKITLMDVINSSD